MAYFSDTYAAYDLHNHTFWSYDAAAQPDMYFRRARQLGIKALALTEHHCFDSWPEIKEIAQAYPEIRVIPSAEITVACSIGPVDLLCYGIPERHTTALIVLWVHYHRWQVEQGIAISKGLEALGYSLTEEDRRRLLLTYRPARVIQFQGLTHIKNQILREEIRRRGDVRGEDEYETLMQRAREESHATPYPMAREVIPVLKDAGILIAIAHPHRYFDVGDRQRMDALRLELRLDGVECAHPNIPPEFTPRYRAYCCEHGLFSVGGTDCHSDQEIVTQFGRHEGGAEWLFEFLDRLDAR